MSAGRTASEDDKTTEFQHGYGTASTLGWPRLSVTFGLPDDRRANPRLPARSFGNGKMTVAAQDAATANIAMYAITAHAQEREAHLREIQLHAQHLPDGSYGRRNRQAITDRETRITTRLRAIEHAYQTAIERGTTIDAAGTKGDAQRADRGGPAGAASPGPSAQVT